MLQFCRLAIVVFQMCKITLRIQTYSNSTSFKVIDLGVN